jgi:hypothetical protein
MYESMTERSAQPPSQEDIRITVKVVPGSSRTEFAGFQGDMVKIKLAAVPEKGKANKELVAFLAGWFNIRKHDVQIHSGQTSRIKQVSLRGVSRQDVHTRFAKS